MTKIFLETDPCILSWLDAEGFTPENSIRAGYLLGLKPVPAVWDSSILKQIKIETIIYEKIYENCLEIGISPSRYAGYLISEFFFFLNRQKDLPFFV